ncbi:hypothetical protein DFJ63DRAFT_237857 [Scheffersomyces coipomensis]|uniref:uncharacterized protein n=1 Tax=Scheffersomyces coipomensis TaxID=1788519 RepID=UPI00315CB7EC
MYIGDIYQSNDEIDNEKSRKSVIRVNHKKRSITTTLQFTKRDFEFNNNNNDVSFGTNLLLGEDPIVQHSGVQSMALFKDFGSYDLYACTGYCYVLLVFGFVVFGAIAFATREYWLSFAKRAMSATSARLRDINWNAATVTGIAKENVEEEKNDIVDNTSFQNDAYNLGQGNEEQLENGKEPVSPAVGYEMERNGSQSLGPQMPLNSIFSHFADSQGFGNSGAIRSSSSESLQTKIQSLLHIKILNDDNGSDAVSEDSITGFIKTALIEREGLGHYNVDKKRYYYKDLYEIRNKINKSLFSKLRDEEGDKQYIKLTTLLTCSKPYPLSTFPSVLLANQAIVDIRPNFIDEKYEAALKKESSPKAESILQGIRIQKAENALNVVKLLSMGASYKLFDNPNYFIPSFNDVIEFIMDNNYLFNIIKVNSNICQYDQSLFIEMVLMYCWTHYTFKQAEEELVKRDDEEELSFKQAQFLSLKKTFEQWNLVDPIVQSRHNIFRYFCNILLGLGPTDWIPQTIRIEIELKAFILLREAVKISVCHEYLSMIPMIAIAIAITFTSGTKYLFYEILNKILKTHSNCCMKEYLQQNDSDLKAIIQHGFWSKNDSKVFKQTEKIYEYLISKKFEIVEKWKAEVEQDGTTFPSNVIYKGPPIIPPTANPLNEVNFPQVPDTPLREVAKVPEFSTARQRPTTPGAWSVLREDNNQGNNNHNNTMNDDGDEEGDGEPEIEGSRGSDKGIKHQRQLNPLI